MGGITMTTSAGAKTDKVDALVIFGATGDLAKLETFPALVGLVERGVLDVPVIGVAKSGWGLDQSRVAPGPVNLTPRQTPRERVCGSAHKRAPTQLAHIGRASKLPALL